MKRLFIALLTLGTIAWACLNDRDTAAIEARNNMELVNVLAGRFERNPPLYYEMRIKRIDSELAKNPAQPELYDDIAVAYERLGKHDDAISWIHRKEPYLVGADKDQVYSYHANLGTFLIHKWFATKSEDKTLLQKGADEIAEALKIKPDAHFGREAMQLYLVQEAIEHQYERKMPFEGDRKLRLKSLLGLMTLGSAWESEEVWQEVAHVLGAQLGMRSMVENRIAELGGHSAPRNQRHSDQYYNALVANGKLWFQHRTEFMLERLKAGRHPDTDGQFWTGYQEVPPVDPKPFEPTWWERNRTDIEIWTILVLIFGSIVVLPAVLIVRAVRKRRARRPTGY